MDSCGGVSTRCKWLLTLLGGMLGLFFELRTRWASNIGING
jgi:hypothetical protein